MKTTALLLCLCMLFTVAMSSCSNKTVDKDDVTTSAQTEAVTDAADARNAISDNLPETDYEGRQFRLYSFDSCTKFFYTEDIDGELINDAIYNAVKTNEGRFNVDIVNIDSGGGDVEHDNAIRAAIMADDDAFDVAENHDSLSGAAAVEGMYVNLYDVDHLDFSKPWWPSNAVDSLTFMNQMYVGSSNMSYKGFHFTRVIYFSKDLIADRGLEEPYGLVFDGKWTLDNFSALAKDVYSDLNGDGSRDTGDLYGYVANDPTYCLLEGFGINPLSKTADGLEVTVNNENTITLLTKFYSLLFESEGGTMTQNNDHITMFGENRALFIYGELGDAVDYFRYDEVNYGILPMPKLSDTQSSYLAAYTDRFFVIPKTATDLDFIGVMLEAMSAEGYKQVIPAYYEVALKQKFTYDDESVQILELINEVRILDFAFVYCNVFNDLARNIICYKSTNNDFASTYAKKEKSIASSVEKVNDAFLTLANG